MATVPRHWVWLSWLRGPRLGARGEFLAECFLRRRGYRILARNTRNRAGEIDLIADDQGTVVFVEVKTRQRTDQGLPVEAVDSKKRRKLIRAALVFAEKYGFSGHPLRMDVVAVVWSSAPEIEHYPHAFEATGAE